VHPRQASYSLSTEYATNESYFVKKLAYIMLLHNIQTLKLKDTEDAFVIIVHSIQ